LYGQSRDVCNRIAQNAKTRYETVKEIVYWIGTKQEIVDGQDLIYTITPEELDKLKLAYGIEEGLEAGDKQGRD
jgi:hypothetical protein